ncbi:DUF4937 domain-containing protein [Alkalihalobacillus macyae]|uniref:DUF4937 domain-containing protein n=1 Tax=Guptibacillus hwajinpoensis TaxID=208199 RepID=UPI00273C41BB|nr:DUF4937 domain-containing protein [Alkalihalobacillus macyae]MDP4549299.1 DUF4937 domain-containing protein [Alkalihalobacillus macyae]
MLIKKIICEVKKDHAIAFALGQKRWKEIKHIDGFVAQYGGWSESEHKAFIIGFWRSRSSYNEFMEKCHDLIYEKTGQGGTIESIDVLIDEKEVDNIKTLTIEWLHNQASTICEEWTITTD